VFDIKLFYRPTRIVVLFAFRLIFYSSSRGPTKASFIPNLGPKIGPAECLKFVQFVHKNGIKNGAKL